jgi:hypothetical protein
MGTCRPIVGLLAALVSVLPVRGLAQGYETFSDGTRGRDIGSALSRLSSAGDRRRLRNAVYTRDGSRSADASRNLLQACLLHASPFQLAGMERGPEPFADRERLFRPLFPGRIDLCPPLSSHHSK